MFIKYCVFEDLKIYIVRPVYVLALLGISDQKLGIFKGKQESKKERKHAFDQEKNEIKVRIKKKTTPKKMEGNGKRKLELNV